MFAPLSDAIHSNHVTVIVCQKGSFFTSVLDAVEPQKSYECNCIVIVSYIESVKCRKTVEGRPF